MDKLPLLFDDFGLEAADEETDAEAVETEPALSLRDLATEEEAVDAASVGRPPARMGRGLQRT